MTEPGTGRSGRLVARDIRVSFRPPSRGAAPTVALDGLTFDVAGGEIVALIGPNGCGKSTFLRAAAGLLRPQRGEITLGGDAIAGPDPRIGLVFQHPRPLKHEADPWPRSSDRVTAGGYLAALRPE